MSLQPYKKNYQQSIFGEPGIILSSEDQDVTNKILNEFIKRFKNSKSKKDENDTAVYSYCELKGGGIQFAFQSSEEAVKFFMEMAELYPEAKFKLLHPDTREIIAFAKNGILYHVPEYTVAKQGDVLNTKGIQASDLDLSKVKSGPSHNSPASSSSSGRTK